MNLYEKLLNNKDNFFLLAGPCVIENDEIPFIIADKLVNITNQLNIPFVFKASFKKANRSRIDSFTGIDTQKAFNILKQIKHQYNIPIVTDIHTENDVDLVKDFVDIIQIPAFLSRQTDLIVKAAHTNKIVNIKKGQFLSADSMQFVCQKMLQSNNNQIMLTERGTFFGYQDLVVDFRSIPIMQQNNALVVTDITHSLQQPNQLSGVSGGNPQMIETIAKAAIAVGSNGLFMETHPDCKNAKSDGNNMLPLDKVEPLLSKLVILKQTINKIK